jgi:hypothetical protein
VTDAGIPEEDERPPTNEPRIADRADFDPDYDPDAPIVCDICGGTMNYTASCRILCLNCGYVRDCADP